MQSDIFYRITVLCNSLQLTSRFSSFSPKDLTVTIGEHDRKVDTGRKSVHHVAHIHRHQDFRLSTFDNDIAIIELREPASINNPWVRVACLPKSGECLYQIGNYIA